MGGCTADSSGRMKNQGRYRRNQTLSARAFAGDRPYRSRAESHVHRSLNFRGPRADAGSEEPQLNRFQLPYYEDGKRSNTAGPSRLARRKALASPTDLVRTQVMNRMSLSLSLPTTRPMHPFALRYPLSSHHPAHTRLQQLAPYKTAPCPPDAVLQFDVIPRAQKRQSSEAKAGRSSGGRGASGRGQNSGLCMWPIRGRGRIEGKPKAGEHGRQEEISVVSDGDAMDVAILHQSMVVKGARELGDAWGA